MGKTKKEGQLMKKVLILYIIFFGCSPVFSQDWKMEYDKQTLVIDSLKKQIIRPLNDSILRLKSANKSIQKQTKTLDDEKRFLTDSINKLTSSNDELIQETIKHETAYLQKRIDSLARIVTELEKIISQKELQIVKEKQIGQRIAIVEKEKGKQEVLDQIIQFYNWPFDTLIKFSTINTVNRDLSLVKNNNKVQQKLLNLQKYFRAKQVLSEKYNVQEVNSALALLRTIDQTNFVKNMIGLLSDYGLSNDAFKATIGDILVIDNQMIANDDYSQEIKLQKVLSKLSWYFRNYRFNFSDYPYLSNIVLEIMNQKQRDANTDISGFLDEL